MNVTVRFSGPFRALAGRHTLSLALEEGATLRDLLTALRDVVSPPFVEQVLSPLETNAPPLVLLLLNRVHVWDQDQLECPLAEGDVVAFAPPMAGG
jgi:molybdopterin converting factor small subunit